MSSLRVFCKAYNREFGFVRMATVGTGLSNALTENDCLKGNSYVNQDAGSVLLAVG